MAAIDKIYVRSYDEYLQFKDWCKEQPKMTDKYGRNESLSSYIYDWDEDSFNDTNSRPIFMAPFYVDAYVIRNCPFEFIQNEYKVNYGGYNPNFGEEATSYNKIKAGELYASATTDCEYEVGKHCRCTKHPLYHYNRPYKAKYWDVEVDAPEGLPFMWFNEDTKTWDFCDEYVISRWKSSMCHIKTIKALMRKIRKWKLPVGTRIQVYGRYVEDTYEFVVTK